MDAPQVLITAVATNTSKVKDAIAKINSQALEIVALKNALAAAELVMAEQAAEIDGAWANNASMGG